MLFLIAQIKSFGTLNTTQKTTALCKAPFLKKSGNWQFFSRFFSITTLYRGMLFFALHSVSQNALFYLLKASFGNV